jgi:hypothetical protein
MPSQEIKPAHLPVPVGLVLVGISEPTGYRRIADGSLKLVPLPGRKKFAVAMLEDLAGRPFSVAEIEAAYERHAANVAAQKARRATLHSRVVASSIENEGAA